MISYIKQILYNITHINSLTKPVKISNKLAKFLNVHNNTKLSLFQINQRFNQYIKKNKCYDKNGIILDEKLRDILGKPTEYIDKNKHHLGYGYSYNNLIYYIKKHTYTY